MEKRRDLPSSLSSLSLSYLSHLFHSPIYRISFICLHLHCACARPTTPLWFTNNTGSCVRLNEQYSTGQSDPNGKHQWNEKVGDRRQCENSPPHAHALQDHYDGKHPSHRQRLSFMARATLPEPCNPRHHALARTRSQWTEQDSFPTGDGTVENLHAIKASSRTEEGIGGSHGSQ